MEMERNGIHSIGLMEFYLSVYVTAFGPLNGRMMVNGVPFFSLFLECFGFFSGLREK